ncbi:MAG: ribonuclease III domain-containing protein [Lachnospiraceae bacterium]|nr:ribonuclease III domain-containing protein [Lachnospiraceae bacterium]
MEENVTLLQKLKKEFVCAEVDIRTYSPLTLAFIGDCIFDLIIRTVVVERGNRAPETLHKEKSRVVKAATQAQMAELLFDELSPEEQDIYRRGRNAKSYTSAKNASITDYRKATGLEALFGYLYLTDCEDRVIQLVKSGLDKMEITL